MEQWINREVRRSSGNVVGHDDADLRQEARFIVWQRQVQTASAVRRCVRSHLNRIRLSWMTEKRMPHDRQGCLLPVVSTEEIRPKILDYGVALEGSNDFRVREGAHKLLDCWWVTRDPWARNEVQFDMQRFQARYPAEFDVIQRHFAESGTLDAPECEDAVRVAREFFS